MAMGAIALRIAEVALTAVVLKLIDEVFGDDELAGSRA